MDITTFCRTLPKVELHAHLNGSISLSTLEFLRQHNLSNGYEQPSDCKWKSWKLLLIDKSSMSLDRCFEMFDMAHSVTTHPSSISLATERVIQEFSEDNVVYLELRSTLRQEAHMTKRQYLLALVEGVLRARVASPSVTVKVLVSINRGEGVDSGSQNIALAIELMQIYPDVIVGVDFSGNPSKGHFSEYRNMLNDARSAGLKVALHCAEIPADNEVLQMVDFKPDRLGHCTCVHPALGGTETTWKSVADSGIPVELCVTSNIKCGTVSCPDQHQFAYFYEKGHPVSIATDDKGVFNTSLSEELLLLQNTFKLSCQQIWTLTVTSLQYAFALKDEKTRLTEVLELWRTENMAAS